MRDDKRTNKQTVKIELLSQWRLEAEFRKIQIFSAFAFLKTTCLVGTRNMSGGTNCMTLY